MYGCAHNQGLCQLFLAVSRDPAPSAANVAVSLFLCSSGSNSRGESRRAPAVSAQKALQGSEMETRELLGGMEEKGVYPVRDY